MLYNRDFTLLSIDDGAVLDGIALSDRHNINSTDASVLAIYLDYARSLSPTDPVCVLVASDKRLLRAGQAEGLEILNPERLAAVDVPAFLAGLR